MKEIIDLKRVIIIVLKLCLSECFSCFFVDCEQAPAADDDDDMDHFGDETEEENKAAEEREATKKDTKKPKESKPLYLFYYKHVSYGEHMCEIIMMSSHSLLNMKF